MPAVVYKATNIVNGKAYIGFTKEFRARKAAHLRDKDNTYFHKALRKYGKDKFVWTILKEDATLQDEIDLIVSHETFGKGYNACEGGSAGTPGYVHTNETKKILSEMAKKQFMDPKQREMIIMRRTGQTMSEETKRKISESTLGVKKSAETKAKMSISKQAMSDETKAKMSEYRTGKRHSKETKRKIALRNKGRVVSPETKRKIAESMAEYHKKKALNGKQITSQA